MQKASFKVESVRTVTERAINAATTEGRGFKPDENTNLSALSNFAAMAGF